MNILETQYCEHCGRKIICRAEGDVQVGQFRKCIGSIGGSYSIPEEPFNKDGIRKQYFELECPNYRTPGFNFWGKSVVKENDKHYNKTIIV